MGIFSPSDDKKTKKYRFRKISRRKAKAHSPILLILKHQVPKTPLPNPQKRFVQRHFQKKESEKTFN